MPKWMMPMLSHSNSLMDEDAGIMSEAETSATGFRRGSKQRSSLPVVRTPSKTMERPLGLVFLQYRHETKRAILPNEITTLDTVRALFVRSFSRQLNMEYFDSHNVRIYIHDSNQDMFYELEDLRDIRDRSILRLFEPDELKQPTNFHSALPISLSQLSFFDDVNNGDDDQPLDLDNPRLMPSSPLSSGTWDDMSYFSEPEFDSDYRPQHIHKANKNKTTKPVGLANGRQASLSSSAPTPRSHIIPPHLMSRNLQARGAALHRSFSITTEQAPEPARIDRNVMSPVNVGSYATSVPCDQTQMWDEDGSAEVSAGFFPCSQQGLPPVPPRPPERSFHNYGTSSNVKPTYVTPSTSLAYGSNPVSGLNRSPVFGNGFNDIRPPASSSLYQTNPGDPPLVDEQTRKRMEQVERQLASLTGLVQTALTGAVAVHVALPDNAPDNSNINSGLPLPLPEAELGVARHLTVKTPRLGKNSKDKCVSFEKSVSFCDDPIDLYEGKHSPQPTESKPAKPAIKSSTLPRASSQVSVYKGDSGWIGSMETYTQLRLLQKNAKDLRAEMRSLRRLSQVQLSAVKEAVKDTIQIMKKTFLVNSDIITNALSEAEPSHVESSLRNIHRQEDHYQKEMKQLENDLSELESSVENLRSHVINKKTRVSMADVEQLAALLSRSSKSADQLKAQFPALEESIKGVLTYQMDRQANETRFLAEAPNKLENTIGRCKKLTSTLVTLRRLASVQEQRQPHTPDKPPLAKSATNYSASVTAEPSSSNPVTRNGNSQQGSSWYQAAQQSGAFAASLELQPTNRAIVVDSASAVRNSSRPSNRCGGQSQRTESRSPTALDALLDELKNYSETTRPGVDTAGSDGQQLFSLEPSMQPIKSTLSTSVPYAESSVDSVVSTANATSSIRRRAPPPPPPRTSSRSPLASPLRSQRNLLQHPSRPLPSLPLAAAESNHLPLVMKVAPLLTSTQSTMLNSQRRNSSLTSDESKGPTVTETSKINNTVGNNQLPPHSTRGNSQQRNVPSPDGLLRASNAATLVPPKLGSPNRRLGQTENNNTAAVAGMLLPPVPPKRDTLESRHQELLKTQRQLQEQYDRLQKYHGVQFVPGVAALPTLQQSSPVTSAAAMTMTSPHHHTNLQKSGTCSDCGHAHKDNNSIDGVEANQETKTDVGNGPSKNFDLLPVDSADFNDGSSQASSSTNVDEQKGRDIFISLLLDNTHETDIL